LFDGSSLDRFKDKLDPEVEISTVKAPERFAKGQIADDVEGLGELSAQEF